MLKIIKLEDNKMNKYKILLLFDIFILMMNGIIYAGKILLKHRNLVIKIFLFIIFFLFSNMNDSLLKIFFNILRRNKLLHDLI